MKGILLAGGTGSRLFPMTKVVNKQLLPIYDKPLIYYPLSVLMLIGIQEVMIVTNSEDVPLFRRLLGDGSELGMKFSYGVQEKPNGLAAAMMEGEAFAGDDKICVILGDNLFYGLALTSILEDAKAFSEGAVVFGYPVKDARSFGVVEFDANGKVLSIEEKPERPRSNFAVPGLYFYDSKAMEMIKNLSPSSRGELEITALNRAYLNKNQLYTVQMGRGLAWLDTGTPQGLKQAAEFVETIQSRQGFYIACLEEIAWRRGFIDEEQLKRLGERLSMTEYGRYILSLLEG